MSELPTRKYPADEITRDPIFLFQRKRHHYDSATHDMYDADRECHIDDNGNRLSSADLVERELACPFWQTEYVYFTREEAEAYGRSRPYDHGEAGSGWRVYCVCANGELAKLLGAATK